MEQNNSHNSFYSPRLESQTSVGVGVKVLYNNKPQRFLLKIHPFSLLQLIFSSQVFGGGDMGAV